MSIKAWRTINLGLGGVALTLIACMVVLRRCGESFSTPGGFCEDAQSSYWMAAGFIIGAIVFIIENVLARRMRGEK